jgi:endonuclease III
MAKETQGSLSVTERNSLLRTLETLGRETWFQQWKEHMAVPRSLNPHTKDKSEQEKILRYLLMRVLINQQASFEKVRQLSQRIAETYGDTLIYEPYNISEVNLFETFRESAGRKGSELYKVGALGGIKPLSLFAYRIKAYEGFVRQLEVEKKEFLDLALDQLKNNSGYSLFKFLSEHPVLECGWVGNDPKACRMLVDWIIFLCREIWGYELVRIEDTLMIVDGHVGKVFCRTGLLSEVLYENTRPYIIQASKMRSQIENMVRSSGAIPFYVDNGAFYLFEDGFCLDVGPRCEECPISKTCKKYIKWTAYQKMTREMETV